MTILKKCCKFKKDNFMIAKSCLVKNDKIECKSVKTNN